jgi:oxygen-dependent protoporphyrinogen oxidase
MTLPIKIAVIGGGITGLAAAHRLGELPAPSGRKLQATLFEASHRCGGLFGSERIGDYLIERGADSFITNKPAALNLCRRLGLAERLISTDPRYRRSLILYRGRPVVTPEGFQLLTTPKVGPILATPLLSLEGKLRLAMERFIPARRSADDESLADFVRRRCGEEALERIIQPLVGGIYTSDPERLSMRATLPRFVEMERRYGSLTRGLRRASREAGEDAEASGARYGLFASLQGGLQELLDALEQRVAAQARLRRSLSVTALRHTLARADADGETARRWELETSDGAREQFDGVIVALSGPAAGRLLAPVDAEIGDWLAKMEFASSAIVVTGHALADISHPMDAFGLVIPHRERRRILAVSFLSRKFEGRAPEGKIILRTFVGGAMQPEEYERTDDEILSTVREELEGIAERMHAELTARPGG